MPGSSSFFLLPGLSCFLYTLRLLCLNPFNDRRRGHAVTDANRLQAILRLAVLQFVDQLVHQDGVGRANQVT